MMESSPFEDAGWIQRIGHATLDPGMRLGQRFRESRSIRCASKDDCSTAGAVYEGSRLRQVICSAEKPVLTGQEIDKSPPGEFKRKCTPWQLRAPEHLR